VLRDNDHDLPLTDTYIYEFSYRGRTMW